MSTAVATAGRRGGRERLVTTPEGVPLRFVLADAAERTGAFLLDLGILFVACILVLIGTLILSGAAGGLGIAAGLVAFFVLRTFYFTFFECGAQGATPGKRALRIRVVDAHGGALTAEAVFARNFMREIEFFVPLVALLAPGSLGDSLPGWARLVSLGWLLVFALLPLFNRDRLRPGDLVGGTIVVRAPRALLLPDLSGRPRGRPGAPAPAPAAFAFTREQLDVYGIYELQVLEDLLRSSGAVRAESIRVVAEKVATRIHWTRPLQASELEPFLREFYTAQRARLEQKMLLGQRQERKRSAARRP
ncbi:MAG: RDD family protein [Vicinamibacteria bacterium]